MLQQIASFVFQSHKTHKQAKKKSKEQKNKNKKKEQKQGLDFKGHTRRTNVILIAFKLQFFGN